MPLSKGIMTTKTIILLAKELRTIYDKIKDYETLLDESRVRSGRMPQKPTSAEMLSRAKTELIKATKNEADRQVIFESWYEIKKEFNHPTDLHSESHHPHQEMHSEQESVRSRHISRIYDGQSYQTINAQDDIEQDDTDPEEEAKRFKEAFERQREQLAEETERHLRESEAAKKEAERIAQEEAKVRKELIEKKFPPQENGQGVLYDKSEIQIKPQEETAQEKEEATKEKPPESQQSFKGFLK